MRIKQIILTLIISIIVAMVIGIPASATTVMSIIAESDDSITVLDAMGRVVTIEKPIDKVAVIDALPQVASTIQAIGAFNKVIAMDERTEKEKVPSPTSSSSVNIGSSEEPDLEKLITLDPDLVIVGLYATDDKIKKLESTGFTVLVASVFPTVDEGFTPTRENTLVLGSILGVVERAEEFVNWRDYYLDKIQENLAVLSTHEKPAAMYTYKWDSNKIYGSGAKNRFHYLLDLLGTTDINADVETDWAEVELEHLIKENPSVLIFEEMTHQSGYGKADPAKMRSDIDSLIALPGMSSVDAVKQGRIFGLPVSIMTGDTWLAAIYLAPAIHPELCGDINPVTVHQEYIDNFLKIPFDVRADGVFLYPPIN